MEIKITVDDTIPPLVELIKFKMYELDIYAEIVNGFKRELEKDVTIRNISKKDIGGGCAIIFDINDDYYIGIWYDTLNCSNTMKVSFREKYEFEGRVRKASIGGLIVSYNPDEPFACYNDYFGSSNEFENELWPKIVSAVQTVVDEMNEKRS